MKLSTVLSAITTLSLLGAVPAMQVSHADAAAICGPLGVMDVTNLPSGVDPNAVRMCKEHPDGLIAKDTTTLEKRACWKGKPVGCSRSGYCYKSCAQPGSGEWCWTAQENGFGPWIRCSKDSDCSRGDQCGAGDCKACGCSC